MKPGEKLRPYEVADGHEISFDSGPSFGVPNPLFQTRVLPGVNAQRTSPGQYQDRRSATESDHDWAELDIGAEEMITQSRKARQETSMRSLRALRLCVKIDFPILLLATVLLNPGFAHGAEIKVLLSGAFTAAYNELIPQFERATGNKIVSEFGLASVGSRIQHGELVDVAILASSGLEELIQQGKVLPDSGVDLARSSIGIAVRAGAPKPDITSVDALKRTLLDAKSIAYSSSVSGVYVSTELFQRLGIASQVIGKSKRIEGMVGIAVAHGDAEIGFQQISELLPVPGIDYLGPLPPEVQRVSVFSAGVVASSKEQVAARALIKFLASPSARPAIIKSGLAPIE